MASLCKSILLLAHFVWQMMVLQVPRGVFCLFLAPLPFLFFTWCCCLFRRGILPCCPILHGLDDHCIVNTKFIFSDSCLIRPQGSPLLNSLSYLAFLWTAASLLTWGAFADAMPYSTCQAFTCIRPCTGKPIFSHMVRLLVSKGILQQPVRYGAVRNMRLMVRIYVLYMSALTIPDSLCALLIQWLSLQNHNVQSPCLSLSICPSGVVSVFPVSQAVISELINLLEISEDFPPPSISFLISHANRGLWNCISLLLNTADARKCVVTSLVHVSW